MATRVAFYVRVSTGEQTTSNQLRELRAVARARRWQVVETFTDHGISGAKGRDRRPAFDRLLKDATRGRFDVVAAWSVDRLGRSLQDLVAFLGELKAAKVDLYLHKQAVDTSTPAGRALFGMLGVFAEFERAIIGERVRAGMARARAQGRQLGRPSVGAPLAAQIRKQSARGRSGRAIGRALGVSEGTVRRVLTQG